MTCCNKTMVRPCMLVHFLWTQWEHPAQKILLTPFMHKAREYVPESFREFRLRPDIKILVLTQSRFDTNLHFQLHSSSPGGHPVSLRKWPAISIIQELPGATSAKCLATRPQGQWWKGEDSIQSPGGLLLWPWNCHRGCCPELYLKHRCTKPELCSQASLVW